MRNILAFGAAGKFGGLVVSALSRPGVKVRGFVRDEKGAAKAENNGATDIAMGDLTDRASIDRALDGIDAVFYLAPAFIPDEPVIGKGVVAACTAAGVKRFVFSSVIHPVISALSNHAGKAPVEEAVLDTEMEYTFLHPALFYQNLSGAWRDVVDKGVLAEPWSTGTRFSRVDYRDVAAVAAIALLEDRLLYGTFELCAEGWLNRHDVASLISVVLEREITADRIDPAALGNEARALLPMFTHYDHVGLRGNALTLRAILGREPRTLEAYFRELAQSDQ